MILRPLFLLPSLVWVVIAGHWPAFVERAALSVRQVIGAEDTATATDVAGGGVIQTPTPSATPATAANPNAVVGADTETAAAVGATAATDTVTPVVADTATASKTTPSKTAAKTPAVPAVPVAPVAPPPAAVAPAAATPPPANVPAASFLIPFDEQTGTMRYAPMPKKPGTSITVKGVTPLYPTSDYNIFMTNAPAGTVVQTVTQPDTYAKAVSREATNIAAAPPPADTNMQKFLNRWRD